MALCCQKSQTSLFLQTFKHVGIFSSRIFFVLGDEEEEKEEEKEEGEEEDEEDKKGKEDEGEV